MTRGLWALAALALLVSPLVAQDAQSFDLIIRAGRVVDGTGNPWVRADVGGRGDRIARIGDLSAAVARRVIDADGLVVAPGFIDPHTHAVRGIFEVPTADNYPAPGCHHADGRERRQLAVSDRCPPGGDRRDRDQPELGGLRRSGTIRGEVIGVDDREPTLQSSMAPSQVVLGGRKVAIRRPRVRRDGAELRIQRGVGTGFEIPGRRRWMSWRSSLFNRDVGWVASRGGGGA